MKINIKVLDDRARFPLKASAGASRYDLVCFDPQRYACTDLTLYRTGLAFEIPEGYEMTIVPRSSTCKKYGMILANQTGVVDSDYRGEVFILMKGGDKGMMPLRPTRLVQIKIEKASVECEWNVVDELGETVRGEGGFGSTG